MIYRVTVKATGSLQPGSGCTYWNRETAYCGASLEEARVEFLRSRNSDHGGGYGSPCQDTVIEAFESDPEEVDSEDEVPVEVED